MDPQIITEFIAMTRRKRDLEAELKTVKQELDNKELQVQEYFADTGFQNVRTENGVAYLHREILASLIPEESGTHEEAHKVLRKHGLDYMIKTRADSSQLRAYVRKTLVDEESELPEDLQKYVNVTDRYRIGVQK